MPFSSQILDIRENTKTNATTFADASLYRKANIVYKNLVTEITQATGHRNSFIKQSYSNLVAVSGLVSGDTGYNGEYALPSDCIIPVRIEVKLADDQLPVPVYDQSENSKSEWVENDLKGDTKLRFIRNSFLLRPLPTTSVTKGIYIEYISLPEVIDEATDTPEFLSLFHNVLSLGVCKQYFMRDVAKYSQELSFYGREYQNAVNIMVKLFQDRLPKNIRFSSNPDYQTNSFK